VDLCYLIKSLSFWPWAINHRELEAWSLQSSLMSHTPLYGFADNWESIRVLLTFDNHLHRLGSWFCHRIVVSTSLDWSDTGDQPIFHSTLSMWVVLPVKKSIVQLLTYITALRFWNGRDRNWSCWIICLEKLTQMPWPWLSALQYPTAASSLPVGVLQHLLSTAKEQEAKIHTRRLAVNTFILQITTRSFHKKVKLDTFLEP
jgi:hypothetical protein